MPCGRTAANPPWPYGCVKPDLSRCCKNSAAPAHMLFVCQDEPPGSGAVRQYCCQQPFFPPRPDALTRSAGVRVGGKGHCLSGKEPHSRSMRQCPPVLDPARQKTSSPQHRKPTQSLPDLPAGCSPFPPDIREEPPAGPECRRQFCAVRQSPCCCRPPTMPLRRQQIQDHPDRGG